MLRVAADEFLIFRFGREERIETLHLDLHFYFLFQTVLQFAKGHDGVFLRVQRGTDGREQVGVVRRDDVLVVQFQGADEGRPQFREEMERSAEECHMSADRLAAGQSADGLVDHRLEDGRRQVFFGRAVVDQRLDIGFGKYTAARRDGVERVIVFRVFIQAGRVRLQKGRHLVDERAGASGADAVHTLFHVAALEVDDLGVLAAQLDGHVRLRRVVLQRRGHGDHFLNERHVKVLCQGSGRRFP